MQKVVTPGVYAAALVPLRPDLSCDIERLSSHCISLMNKGCTGIALFGTTGEGPSFSVSERIEALEGLIARGVDPKKIILANGSGNIADTIELGKACVKYGCGAFLVVPPSFYKNISDEGVIAYYRSVIERIKHPDLRLILYHIPQYSGVPLSLMVIETLRKEFPQIVVGVKESEGNLDFTRQILQKFPHFQVFVGNERQIIESVHLGGAGTICGIANLYPELIASLYEQGKKDIAPNPPELDKIFETLTDIPFIPAAKWLMEQREGSGWNRLRPPLTLLPPTASKGVATLCTQETLSPFSSVAKSVTVGSVYEHYKGMRYKILGVARHSETLEEMVVYQGLYGEGDIWVRPLGMFLETLNGKPRFKKVDNY